MKNKNFIQEIIIFTMVLISSFLIYSNIKTIDLFTYLFTTSVGFFKEWIPFLVFLNILLLLLVFLFVGKQLLQKFKHKTTQYILISLCVLCILLLTFWTPQSNLEEKYIFTDGTLTIYPPLSALNDDNLLVVKEEITFFETGIFYIQIFLIILMAISVLVSFRKSKPANN